MNKNLPYRAELSNAAETLSVLDANTMAELAYAIKHEWLPTLMPGDTIKITERED